MTPAQRKATAAALATALAIPAEGLRQVYYYDPPGILTVCYGHTGKDIDKKKFYSIAECRGLLNKDMNEALDTVERCAPGLPVPALAAFGDAVYNLGPKIVCNTTKSTAARLLKAGFVREACLQLPRWNKSIIAGVAVPLRGLTDRRNKERELCLTSL